MFNFFLISQMEAYIQSKKNLQKVKSGKINWRFSANQLSQKGSSIHQRKSIVWMDSNLSLGTREHVG